MSLQVPLAVAVGGDHITREVSGLSVRKEAVGGVRSISLRLARPLSRFDATIAPYTRVYLYDTRTGECVAEGRISDTGRSAGVDGQQWDLVAFGPAQHATDDTIPYVVIDSQLDPWVRSQNSSKNASTGQSERPTKAPSLLESADQGKDIAVSWTADMIYRVVNEAGQKLARVSCSWDAGVTDANYLLGLYTATGAGASTGAADSHTANTGASGTFAATVGGANFSNGDDVVSVRTTRNTSTTSAGPNQWFEFWNICVRALLLAKDGTEVTSGYSNDYVLAHEIVRDLLGRALPQFDGANATVDTSATYQIDQFAYPDCGTPAQFFDDLMLLIPSHRWLTRPSVDGGKYQFSWEPWPTTVRYEVTLDDGGDFPISSQELYNHAFARWQSNSGRVHTKRASGPCPILDAADDGAGIDRTALVDLGSEIGSENNAARILDNFLADHKYPANAGTLTIARPIKDRTTGRTVRPHQIEAGELVRVNGLESYPDALNASSNDGRTVFRIMAVTYNSDQDAAVCELDTWPRTTAHALARLQRRRHRKR